MYKSQFMQKVSQDESKLSSILDQIQTQSVLGATQLQEQANTLLRPYQNRQDFSRLKDIAHKIQNHKSNIKLSLDDVSKAVESRGVYEEINNSKLLALCYIRELHVGVEGPSGSGKSHLVNSFLDCITDPLYTCSLSSPTAMYYDDKVNESNIIYFSELQKAGRDKTLLEILKDLSEGKSSKRVVTTNKHTTNFEITPDKQLIYTLADENKFDLDHELSRRFIRLKTNMNEDALKERKRRILFDQASKSPLEIGTYLSSLKSKRQITESHPDLLIDLFPSSPKIISYMKHYCELVKAHAQFHERSNTTHKDHKAIFDLYGETFEHQLSKLEGKPVKLNEDVIK